MTTTVIVSAGPCGITSKITAQLLDPQAKNNSAKLLKSSIKLSVETSCNEVIKLIESIKEFKVMDLFKNFLSNPIYIAASRNLKHVTCPVPSAILKAIEVEAGFAVKKDVEMRFL